MGLKIKCKKTAGQRWLLSSYAVA